MAERLSPNETKKVDVPVKDSKHDVAVKVAENMAEEHRGKTVVSNNVKPKKPTFGDKLKGCFFEGEVETVSDYIVFDVIVPAIKSTIVNVVCGGIESLVNGKVSTNRPSARPNYTQYSGPRARPNYYAAPVRQDTSRAPEYEYETEEDAYAVLEQMNDILGEYEWVRIADYKEASGIRPDSYDYAWGWNDLRSASVRRNRNGGFFIDLPRPLAERR